MSESKFESEPVPYSDSDQSDSSPMRSSMKHIERSSRSRGSSHQRQSSPLEFDDLDDISESDWKGKKEKRSSRTYTEEEIVAYLARKAQKKVTTISVDFVS